MLRVVCPSCGTPVLEPAVNQNAPASCNGCSNFIEVAVFPALFRQNATGQSGELVVVEGDATCFNHSNKKAVCPCDACGRFLCTLCDCELNGDHFCPTCLETGKSKNKIQSLQNQRTLYDSIALGLVVLPVVTLAFWFLTIFTAPAALVTALVYWNAPRSIVHRTKIRYVLAIIIALAEIVFWAFIIYVVYSNLARRGR